MRYHPGTGQWRFSSSQKPIISPCPTLLYTATSFLNIPFLNSSPTYHSSLFQGLSTKIMYRLPTSCQQKQPLPSLVQWFLICKLLNIFYVTVLTKRNILTLTVNIQTQSKITPKYSDPPPPYLTNNCWPWHSSEILIDLLTITTVRLSSSYHQLLHLTDTQHLAHCWRSIGQSVVP
jgi:hypothetical protein